MFLKRPCSSALFAAWTFTCAEVFLFHISQTPLIQPPMPLPPTPQSWSASKAPTSCSPPFRGLRTSANILRTVGPLAYPETRGSFSPHLRHICGSQSVSVVTLIRTGTTRWMPWLNLNVQKNVKLYCRSCAINPSHPFTNLLPFLSKAQTRQNIKAWAAPVNAKREMPYELEKTLSSFIFWNRFYLAHVYIHICLPI